MPHKIEHIAFGEVLETPRLWLRKVDGDTYRWMFRHASKEEIFKQLGLESESRFERFAKRVKENQLNIVHYQFWLKSELRFLGSCGYHNIQREHDRGEIGYALNLESDRRKGYMKEAFPFVLHLGFDTLGFHRIEATTDPTNTASRALLTSFQFREEGVLREHYQVENSYRDSVLYSLLKHEAQW